MGYGYKFASKSKLIAYAKEHAPNNPHTEYELAVAIDALESHKLAQENFFEFLRKNQEQKDNHAKNF